MSQFSTDVYKAFKEILKKYLIMKNRTLHLLVTLFLFSLQSQSQVIAGGNNDFENDLTGWNT